MTAEQSGAADRLRAAYSLDLETEGIPVVLALVGVSGPLPPSGQEGARADGARLAGQARSLHAELWPGARGDDLFVTYAVLATVALTDLDARTTVASTDLAAQRMTPGS